MCGHLVRRSSTRALLAFREAKCGDQLEAQRGRPRALFEIVDLIAGSYFLAILVLGVPMAVQASFTN
jgi:hypothetical protein